MITSEEISGPSGPRDKVKRPKQKKTQDDDDRKSSKSSHDGDDDDYDGGSSKKHGGVGGLAYKHVGRIKAPGRFEINSFEKFEMGGGMGDNDDFPRRKHRPTHKKKNFEDEEDQDPDADHELVANPYAKSSKISNTLKKDSEIKKSSDNGKKKKVQEAKQSLSRKSQADGDNPVVVEQEEDEDKFSKSSKSNFMAGMDDMSF